MDVVLTHGAGLDVHKKTVMACRVTPAPMGQQADGLMDVQALGTLTRNLLALADWWTEAGITPAAMESTGEYWTPVYNLLEGTCTVFLVNAAHVKYVPGRKTDQGHRRGGLVPAAGRPPREEACHHGGRPRDRGECLLYALAP